jgi:hypothetical protein
MAKLIPTFNSSSSDMTGGEKRLGQSLEDNLEDDYTIWYDVPVGKKNLRPDFTILHPQRGLLVLEVKDWKIGTIQDANRKSFTIVTNDGVKSVINPLEQARKYVLAIKQLLCQDRDLVQPDGKYAGQLICPYGYGLVLANITRKAFVQSELDSILDEYLVICQDEIKPKDSIELQEKLWGMYPYTFDRAVTPQQVDRIRWLMFPTFMVGASTNSAATAYRSQHNRILTSQTSNARSKKRSRTVEFQRDSTVASSLMKGTISSRSGLPY